MTANTFTKETMHYVLAQTLRKTPWVTFNPKVENHPDRKVEYHFNATERGAKKTAIRLNNKYKDQHGVDISFELLCATKEQFPHRVREILINALGFIERELTPEESLLSIGGLYDVDGSTWVLESIGCDAKTGELMFPFGLGEGVFSMPRSEVLSLIRDGKIKPIDNKAHILAAPPCKKELMDSFLNSITATSGGSDGLSSNSKAWF